MSRYTDEQLFRFTQDGRTDDDDGGHQKIVRRQVRRDLANLHALGRRTFRELEVLTEDDIVLALADIGKLTSALTKLELTRRKQSYSREKRGLISGIDR